MSADNHLVGEAAGLTLTGLAFPHLERAGEWIKKGIAILSREIAKQIYPDGVFAEQSVHYGSFSMDFWLAVMISAGHSGMTVPRIWHERLEKAGDFIGSLMNGAGSVPRIGDDDGGCAYRLSDHPEFNNYDSILNTLAVLFEEGGFKRQDGPFDEKTFWLLGIKGADTFERLEPDRRPRASKRYEDGGYCVFRSGDSRLVLDCGSLGYANHAGHGHADALGVLLSVGDNEVFLDPGMPCYHEDPPMRDAFRSTRAHNTVVVDHKNQSVIGDKFLWLRKANAWCEDWQTNGAFESASGAHDGYKESGVVHRRAVAFLKPRTWVIVDRLSGSGPHDIEQYWHLGPHVSVNRVSGLAAELEVGPYRIDVFFEGPDGFRAEILEPIAGSAIGWMSEGYGNTTRADVLCFRGTSTVPVILKARIVATFT
jgi:hypothetical protein